MNRNKIISLADVQGCPATVTAFYNRYRERITGIETVNQRNNILSDMQQDFERGGKAGAANQKSIIGNLCTVETEGMGVYLTWQPRNK